MNGVREEIGISDHDRAAMMMVMNDSLDTILVQLDK